MELHDLVFLSFLMTAAWQDFREKSVSVLLYAGYGLAACVIRLANADWNPMVFCGLGVGGGMLLIGRLTQGAIGNGDGWFFIVGGLYLSVPETILLLLNGLAFCGIFCLILIVYGRMRGKSMRGITVPFLPFLVPAWIWMVIS